MKEPNLTRPPFYGGPARRFMEGWADKSKTMLFNKDHDFLE